MSIVKRALQILIPAIIVTAAVGGGFLLVNTPPEAKTNPPARYSPLVRAHEVKLQDLALHVTSEGTVRPVTESTLVPEVSGVVVSVARAWANGGFFTQGEILLQIDPTDYELTVAQAEAQVAQAEVGLSREVEEAAVALKEWESLGADRGEPPPLVARPPQLAERRALLKSALASLNLASLNLERTTVRAPYAGRVRQKSVDVGQYVARGTAIATIYSVEKAEVRLPLANSELAFIDLPLSYRGEGDTNDGPEVLLSTSFAGKRHEWRGRVVRTEGEIDPRSRQVHAVAQVDDPYSRSAPPDRPPLAVGMFVQARILGHTLREVSVLPRHALRDGDTVFVVDEESRIRFRSVTVARKERDTIVITEGLTSGDRVCVSPLDVVSDGMTVRLAGAVEAPSPAASSGSTLPTGDDGL